MNYFIAHTEEDWYSLFMTVINVLTTQSSWENVGDMSQEPFNGLERLW